MLATPVILSIDKNNCVYFTLSNKPHYLCKIDISDYEKLLDGKNCYYIKEQIRNGKVVSKHIARADRSRGKSETHFLHWDISGKRNFRSEKRVSDHINNNQLDNRRDNLRQADLYLNSRNSDRCRNSLAKKHKLRNGYTLALRDSRGSKYFQAYCNICKKITYLKSSKDIKVIKEAIKNHHSETHKRRSL